MKRMTRKLAPLTTNVGKEEMIEKKYSDGRPAAKYRLEAEDAGMIFQFT